MQSRWVLIRQARRMRLLRGAGQIFAQIGFERSSMNVIAEVCGVTKATVYAHFWQQGRVLKAVVEQWLDEMPKSALPSPNEGGLGKRLSDVVRELLLQAEHPSSVALAQMLRHSTSVPTPVLERWRQRRSLQRRVLTTCSTRTSATWPRAGKKALSKRTYRTVDGASGSMLKTACSIPSRS